MAIKSTVFKVHLNVSDLNRHYYEDHALTLARHPSETDVRMLVRVIAFALNAHERLQLTKGLADVDEPDLWRRSLTGEIEHWIELGHPPEKRIRQSCSKALCVSIYTYQRSAATTWYESVKATLARFQHLSVMSIAIADEAAVARIVDRSMRLTCVIESDQVTLSNDVESLNATISTLKVGRER